MAVLVVFAFVAGAGTALSPCVLPVLPIALSAGMGGGRRRRVGVVAGLALSFTFATVALVYLIDAVGLPDGLVRTLAIVTLIAFGPSLVIPPVAARVEALLSRATGGVAPGREGDGFGSGLVLGARPGAVYAPRARPVPARGLTLSGPPAVTPGRPAAAP